MEAVEVQTAADEELVQRFLGGETRAFEVLVTRHQNRVFGMCVRLLGTRSQAEEAAQEVFVKVYRNLARFRGDSRFTTWLYRVTINHCRNVQAYRARRHEKRHESIDAQVEGPDGPRPKRQLADDQPSAQDKMEGAERSRMLHEELTRLEDFQREVLVLRDVEDLSYEEIGGLLDLAPGTVKSRIHRARSELKGRILRRMKREGKDL